MNTLSISNTHIRQDNQGRYCLNDLHKAAGDNSKHQPANFLRLATTKELVEEISRCSDMRSHSSEMRTAVEVVNGGKAPGTYVAKEIVYAYAMWISPKFSLQVIRAYDALATQPDPDDELATYYLHPDGQYRLERPALAQGYTIPTHFAALQAELLKANPSLKDVLNLTRLGYSQARIGEMLGLGNSAVYRAVKRLRGCGFSVCADTARLPGQGGAA
ncbi:MAG: KilA-N domain-containing protein [Methylovulum sp.]|nr:KilA-N domain-containing protein [Methylovulum sp.]